MYVYAVVSSVRLICKRIHLPYYPNLVVNYGIIVLGKLEHGYFVRPLAIKFSWKKLALIFMVEVHFNYYISRLMLLF